MRPPLSTAPRLKAPSSLRGPASSRLLGGLVWIWAAAVPVMLSAESSDLIISARYVVTMDAQQQVIEDGAVAIRGERIQAVGKRADIDKRYSAAQRIDKGEAIVMPGLINTHAHAAMSLFRGIADDM